MQPSRAAKPAATTVPLPRVQTGSFVSAARGGVETKWAICRPAQAGSGPLRPVIALHARTGDANSVMGIGVAEQLKYVVEQGAAPFAVASVDGGDTYWHARRAGGDSGAMVLDEFLPLLEREGLDTTRFAFMGWSMGGYGALRLGAQVGSPRVTAISVTSPALWTVDNFPPVAFDDADDFERNSIWDLPGLANIPVRLDIGDQDQFAEASRSYIAKLATPPAGGMSPGRHDGKFAMEQLRGELEWLAPYVTANA